MNLPIQSEPVQRTTVGQTAVIRGETVASGHGIVPSQYGVDASDWLDDIIGGASKVINFGSKIPWGALGI